MATGPIATEHGTLSLPRRAKAGSRLRYDWVVALASLLFGGGFYLDSWAHQHGQVDQTFFTPWHAVLYFGFLVLAVIVLGAVIDNTARGYPLQKAIPVGYRLSIIGLPLFALAGIGDLIWHTLFGFELDLEAFLSPTHLLLLISVMLIVTGPLRAAWQRVPAERESATLRGLLPAILSATCLLSGITFITFYNHPLNLLFAQLNSRMVDGLGLGLSILGMVLASATWTSILLLMLRRWQLPFGTLTVMLTVNSVLIVTQRDHYYLLPVPAITGIVGDLLLVRLRPSPQRLMSVRWFALLVPVVYYVFYFGELAVIIGVGWTIHLWAGTIVLCAATALMLSYAIFPPAMATEGER